MENISNEKSTILVVDDDLINFQSISDLLIQDYNLLQLDSKESWISEIAENTEKRIDLILVNYIISGINGLKFIDQIRSNSHFEQIPIIMYSLIDEDSVVESAFNRGVFDFIKLPFKPGNLKSRVVTALGIMEERHQKKTMAVINNLLGNSLQLKNQELEKKNQELREFNSRLQKIVDEKTIELQFANDNLKSYSHNLEQLIDKKTSENLSLHKNAIIGDMISGFIHNLRTPLTIIKAQMDLLKKITTRMAPDIGVAGDPLVNEVEKRSKIIGDSVNRIDEMLKNLMLKKRDDGIIEKTKISPNDFLEKELVFLNANSDFKHNIYKEVYLGDNIPSIFAVASDLSQILYNLINNSMDAMWQQKDKKMIFRTRSDNDWVYMDIEDNGPGISPENLSRLFDPFFTTKPSKDKAVNGEPAGTGLGLHSVKQIVNANDGKINYYSTVGQGTRAEVCFRRIN